MFDYRYDDGDIVIWSEMKDFQNTEQQAVIVIYKLQHQKEQQENKYEEFVKQEIYYCNNIFLTSCIISIFPKSPHLIPWQ